MDDDCDPLDVLVDTADPAVREAELRHNHLPRLEELGYISWNRDTHEISKGPTWDEVEPLLTLIDEHRDELPDEWF